jgi:CoA:oxalate CoA-transferase
VSRPLDGVRVLDHTRAQQGPFATALMADMGAEIIKIERRDGELGRHIFPVDRPGDRPVGYFVAHNRGKHSVTLDLKQPKAIEIVKRLAERVEVVVNNFRPGVMKRLGLGYDDLRALNPAIVYGSASGFGPLGPMAGRPGVDILGQAMGGIMTKTGDDGGPPMPAGASIGDQTGAILLAVGVLAALLRARSTGEGEEVDVSLYGSQIALQSWEITTHSMLGRDAGRGGLGHPEASKRGIWRAFEASDGWFVLGSVDMYRFQRLSKLVGAPELSETYPDDARRAAGLEVINDELERRFHEQPRTHWFPLFEEQDIIFAPVQSYDDVLASEQAWANGYVQKLPHAALGEVTVAGSPIQFGREPSSLAGPAPELGDSTERYMEELGYGWDEIATLRDRGVI